MCGGLMSEEEEILSDHVGPVSIQGDNYGRKTSKTLQTALI